MVNSYDSLRKMAQIVVEAQNNDYDMFIAVSGFERVGKSSFSYALGNEVYALQDSPKKVTPEKDMAFDTVDFIEKVGTAESRSVRIADEGVRCFYNLDYNKADVKEATKLISQIGSKNLCCIINLPRFGSLLPYLRDHRCAFWVDVVDRGHAVVFQPDQNRWLSFFGDPWHSKENYKKCKVFESRFSSVDNKIDAARKSIGYFGYVRYPKMPPEVEARYKAYSDAKKVERSDGVPNSHGIIKHRGDLWKARSTILLKMLLEKGETKKGIAAKLGMKDASVLSQENQLEG